VKVEEEEEKKRKKEKTRSHKPDKTASLFCSDLKY
jgi:hypothetical protein